MTDIIFNLFPGNKKKALTMSYDDGTIHDRRLVEIFNKYGIRGTFHLNSGRLDQDGVIRSDEVAGLFDGHEVSCHTVSHPSLTLLAKESIYQEIAQDKLKLETLTNDIVRGMSYPYGTYDQNVIDVLRSAGMEYSRTTVSTHNFTLPADFMAWHPTCHHRENIVERLNDFLTRPRWNHLPVFYVWGHSYEFDRNNNWELIEEFCEKASGQEDVWYATNIEIVEYVQALRQLKISADGSKIYNPTATDVWVTVNKLPAGIPAGCTTLL